MPNSNSSKKRLRQNEKRRQQNRSVKSALRTQLRKVKEAVTSGDLATSEEQFKTAVKKLDRAAAHNIIHRNAAARTKSRLSAKVKSLKTSASA